MQNVVVFVNGIAHHAVVPLRARAFAQSAFAMATEKNKHQKHKKMKKNSSNNKECEHPPHTTNNHHTPPTTNTPSTLLLPAHVAPVRGALVVHSAQLIFFVFFVQTDFTRVSLVPHIAKTFTVLAFTFSIAIGHPRNPGQTSAVNGATRAIVPRVAETLLVLAQPVPTAVGGAQGRGVTRLAHPVQHADAFTVVALAVATAVLVAFGTKQF